VINVFVPEQGDRYHIYEDCSRLPAAQLGNAAQGNASHAVRPMPLGEAEALRKTLCRDCHREAVQR
jgi:hypothetical protein